MFKVITNIMKKSMAVTTVFVLILCAVDVYGGQSTTTPPWSPTTAPPSSSQNLTTPSPLSPQNPTTPSPMSPQKSTTPSPLSPQNSTTPSPLSPQKSTAPPPLSPQELLAFVLQTINLLPNTITLDELATMLAVLPSMDEQTLITILQGLNVDVPSFVELGNALTVLQSLDSLLSWATTELPNGNVNDLLNKLSTMDELSLNALFQSLNIDVLTSAQFGDALTLIEELINSVPDGNVPLPTGDNLNDLLDMISTMDAQSLKLLLQSLGIDSLDPSQLGGALSVLQDLQGLLSAGNIQLTAGDVDDLLKMISTMDETSLKLLLKSLNIDGLDTSKLGDALTLVQAIQGSLSGGDFQLSNGTSVNPLDYLDLTALSPGCTAALEVLIAELTRQKPWAFRLLDSWGKPAAGILDGNLHWLGSYDQCMAIKPEETPFETNYCVSGNESALLLGMCLPKICTPNDIYNITNSVLALIPLTDPPTVSLVRCKTDNEYDTRAIIAISVCGFFFVLMVIATLFDVILVSPKLKGIVEQPAVTAEDDASEKTNGVSEISKVENGGENGENGTSTHHVKIKYNTKTGQMQTNGAHPGYMYKHNDDTVPTKTTPTPQYQGLCTKLILSFSVWTNGKRLLSTEQTEGTLGAINGIRFFSMSWIILAHSFTSALDSNAFVNEGSGVSKKLQHHSFMAVSNGYVSVDSFFAMSGLLVSYMFMKEMKKEKGRINWFTFLCHRFWRLTPPYMLVMMMDIALFRYVGDGPYWLADGIETDFCKDTWWTNLLYINNFVKTGKSCFSWSWYMANDMQFYVLSPLLLVPLYFSKKIGGIVIAIFLFGVTGASGYISYHNELPSTQYSSNSDDYFQMYYSKPYCRMGPYIVGIIFGHILSGIVGKYTIKQVINVIIWTLMSALACAVLYGTYQESSSNTISVVIASLYNSVHRTVWGVCVCWVVFACVTGNGGFVNTFLSWSLFVPLRRLTYCAYLVHPLVTAAYYRSLRQQMYMTDYNMIYLFIGHLLTSYMVACVIFLAFQSPLMGLERAFSRKDRKDKKEKK